MPEHVPDHEIRVPFSGTGAGTAPLTWGQKAILKDMRETGWTHNASGAHIVPEGLTVEAIAAEWGHLMSTFPALRMRLGLDEQGRPCQVITEAGEISLGIFDVADDADPGEKSYHLWYDWLLTPFDLYQDWSMRMGVVRHRGVPAWRPWTINHVVVDGSSISLLMAEIGLGGETVKSTGDPRTIGVLELGHREQTPAVRRISDRAMGYWEARLRSIPPLTFGEPTHPEGRQGKRYWHGTCGSPAAYLAMLAIARRTKSDTSRVLQAIIATAIARVTEITSLTAKVIVSNRFRPGLAETIAALSQDSLLTINVADATLDEVIFRARQASMVAAKYAYYDPDQLDALTARLDRERGYPARVSCRLNDRRMHTRRDADEAARDCEVTMEQIEQLLPKSFISWDGTVDHLPEQAFITVEDHEETVYLQVIFDMACFTEAEVEALLRGVEEVAIEAAFDPGASTRIKAA